VISEVLSVILLLLVEWRLVFAWANVKFIQAGFSAAVTWGLVHYHMWCKFPMRSTSQPYWQYYLVEVYYSEKNCGRLHDMSLRIPIATGSQPHNAEVFYIDVIFGPSGASGTLFAGIYPASLSPRLLVSRLQKRHPSPKSKEARNLGEEAPDQSWRESHRVPS
jgi:hypothetical protein